MELPPRLRPLLTELCRCLDQADLAAAKEVANILDHLVRSTPMSAEQMKLLHTRIGELTEAGRGKHKQIGARLASSRRQRRQAAAYS